MRQFKRAHIIETDLNRWMVSYADFITLLFAFFVVMYAVSSINERKYKKLSSSLQHVFSKQKLGIGSKRESISDAQPVVTAKPSKNKTTIDANSAEELITALDDLRGDFIKVDKKQGWVELEIKSNSLFSSAKAKPSADAVKELQKLADVLKSTMSPIAIEGYTDNRPINTPQFPSNWELSAARAAAVARVLMDNGVKGSRLSATGFGAQYPVASNLEAIGRAKNRRVVIVVAKDASIERLLNPALSTSVKYMAEKRKKKARYTPIMEERRTESGSLKFTRSLKKEQESKAVEAKAGGGS